MVALGSQSIGYQQALGWLWAALSGSAGMRDFHAFVARWKSKLMLRVPAEAGGAPPEAQPENSSRNHERLERHEMICLGWTCSPQVQNEGNGPCITGHGTVLVRGRLEDGLVPGTGLLRPSLPRNHAAARALPGRLAAATRPSFCVGPTPPETQHKMPVDALRQGWETRSSMNESDKQFFFTRAASNTSRGGSLGTPEPRREG
jgi:hypothetical protein